MAESVQKQLDRLRAQIRHHDHLYYVLNSPELSDQQYDEMYARLKGLEEKHPDLVTADSPTQRVAGEPLDGFETVTHSAAMLSIDNTYSADELRQFDQRVQKGLEEQTFDYVVEPKIDGVAVALRYEKGLLVLGATRGNGIAGDNITQNIRTVASVPLRLVGSEKELPEVLEVRGEVFMPLASFKAINAKRAEADEPLFANPRNATAGSLKMLDSRMVAQRKLDFLAYTVGQVEPADLAQSHSEMLEMLKALGLPVSEHTVQADTIEAVIEHCDAWEERKNALAYMTDGMVVKVNRFAQQRHLGQTARAPRWCIAYKFAAERAETMVESIDVQVGKTGALTPVANLKPVALAGTTVSRASLHNFDELARKDVRVGDSVLVEKAGEIIPQVIEVLIEKRADGTKSFAIPKACPKCEGPVHKDEEGVYIRCVNPNCPAQLIERLRHFSGRNQMDIDGLGIALIEQMVEQELVGEIADIYRLDTKQILELERMGEKSADNLIAAIDRSKAQPLGRVLSALGILHVGSKAALVLAEYSGSIENLLAAEVEQLETIDEIGPVIAQSVYEFCHNKKTRQIIDDLIALGLAMPGPEKPDRQSAILEGKTVVVTGTIEGYSRQDMENLIRLHGGKPSGSVSKKTGIVVIGDNPGSKAQKAKALGVEILSGDEFLGLLGES